MDSTENVLERAALGRVAFVGELYDARSETFSSTSIFKKDRPESLIKKTDVNRMEMDYKFTENLSERFKLLNIEGEVQVCLLSGLIRAEGSGKFLQGEKKTYNSISCSLICQFQTVSEKFLGSLQEYIEYLDLSLLASDRYTHLVTETVWGANCIINLESTFESESKKSEVEGSLKGKIDKIASMLKARGNFDLDSANASNQLFKDIKVTISADVVPEGELPITARSFCNLVTTLPDLLKKSNEGKGKPLKYGMIPVSVLREIAKVEKGLEIVVKKIDESFLIATVCCFEDISALKLKISDLIDSLKKHEKYVSRPSLLKARQQYDSLKQKESSLKDLLSKNWVAVKSGSLGMRDFIREVEKFKSHNLQLFQFEEYLESCSEMLEMINEIEVYISAGVTYFGRGESPSQEFIKNVASNFVVLVKSKTFETENSELHQATCVYFISLVHQKSENTRYMVVDLDCVEEKNSTEFRNFTMTTCLLMKEGKVIKSDLYKEYLSQLQSNFMKIKGVEITEKEHYKPGNRVLLEVTCPGWVSNKCSSKKQIWNCYFCKEVVEYGFDGYFYCNCGRAQTTYYEYCCSDSKHGTTFILAPTDFLSKELSVLRPFPEVNILILGQTGVGKSTWINSIVNYMKYDSLNHGRQAGVICTIPIRFTHFDVNGQEYDVKLGDPDDGEVLVTGQSATQYCRTYCFYWKNKYFRIIDTPGIADVRGITRDKENMRHIIDYIGHLNELHGVCILLKANESKIGAVFSYCLKELLVHLHKDVAKNIVFCFTNARNSFYSPGQTSVLLRKLLTNLHIGDQDLCVGQHNSFCLDNEAFLFLCMLQYPEIQFPNHLFQDFEQSWNISVKETHRLFEAILEFKPHELRQTVSLCTARNRILFLSKPLAEICKTVQMNIRAIEQYKDEVEKTEKTVSELKQNLYYDEVHLESVNLTRPRTVCTSPRCVNYINIKSLGVTEIEYKTHCHVNCILKNVVPKTVNNVLLKDCTAMKNGVCTECGCGWQVHMHLLAEQKRVVKQVKSKLIEDDINKNLSEKEAKQKIIQDLENKIRDYKEEQDTITAISVKMGMFLKSNAISVYNDAISDYLRYMIEEAENNPRKTSNDKELLKQLKEMLERYEKEMEVLQKAVEARQNPSYVPTLEDIYKLERDLYSLKLTGKDIENYVNAQIYATSKQIKYSEVQLRIPKNKTSRNKEKNEGYLASAKNYVVKKANDFLGKTNK